MEMKMYYSFIVLNIFHIRMNKCIFTIPAVSPLASSSRPPSNTTVITI